MEQAQTAQKEENKPQHLSRGEKIFNWLVYGAVNAVGTFIITLPLGYWTKYGSVAKYFERGTNFLVKKGMNPSMAEPLLSTTALVHGGNLMVAAVKVAEDNKIPIIKKIDEIIGDKTDVAALEQQDKQTWPSLIKGRILAWLTVYTALQGTVTFAGADKLAAIENGFAKNVVCKMLGRPTHVGGRETKTFRYGKLAALDIFATAAAATLLYIGSRFFAKSDKKNLEVQCEELAKEKAVQPEALLVPVSAQNRLGRPKDESFAATLSRRAETAPAYVLGA